MVRFIEYIQLGCPNSDSRRFVILENVLDQSWLVAEDDAARWIKLNVSSNSLEIFEEILWIYYGIVFLFVLEVWERHFFTFFTLPGVGAGRQFRPS